MTATPLPKLSVDRFCRLFLLLIFLHQSAKAQLRADFTMDKQGGCAPLAVAFRSTTTGASPNAVYHWNLGNGNTASVQDPGAIYQIEQDYTVTLTVEDGGQTSTKTAQVTVYKKPVADFTVAAAKVCLTNPATFTSTSTPGSGYLNNYYWDFGDGSTQSGGNVGSHVYAQEQLATVSLTVTNNYGCHHTVVQHDILRIIPKLTAGFTADKRVLCRITDPVQFTNTSAGPGTLSYKWDFGDGTTSTTASPSHVFNKKGIYTISLTVTSSEGCQTTFTQPAFVNVASYNTDFNVPSLICEGSVGSFTSTSTPSPTSTVWEINGSPVPGYPSSMDYYFISAGTYTIKLSNTFGTCAESVTKQVSVKPRPKPQGIVVNLGGLCGAPVNVQFKDTTPGAVKWSWDFDFSWGTPNVHATTQTPTHTYTSDGYRQVRLDVTNADGCSQGILRTVNIERPWVTVTMVSATSPRGSMSCGPNTIKFSTNSSEAITSYQWNFGDGGTSALPEPTHTYTAIGTYTVQLRYTTVNGCTGTAVYIGNVDVASTPKVDFTASPSPTEVCTGSRVTFTVQPFAQNTWYSWNFGDGGGNSSSNSTISYQYRSSGIYTVRLTASRGACDTSFEKTALVKVSGPTAVILNYSNTCAGTRGEVSFTQTSVNATTVTWNFGDGSAQVTTPGTQTNIIHTYTRTGNFTVTLTAKNGNCTSTHSTLVNVLLKQNPVLASNNTDICVDQPMNFTISNLERNPVPNSWNEYYYYNKWEYGDGTVFNGNMGPWNINTIPFPATLSGFERDKDKIRVLLRSYFFNCVDTSNYLPIRINGPDAGFEIVKDAVCYKDAVVFKDTSKAHGAAIQSVQWTFGDGQTQNSAGGATVSHTYNDPGYYYTSLMVTDVKGCRAYTSIPRSVAVYGPKVAISASSTSVPQNATVYFYNGTNTFGSLPTTWQWNFGDGGTSTDQFPSHIFATPGKYSVTLKASNPALPCVSEAELFIEVRKFNSYFSITLDNITGKQCAPVLAKFVNTSSNYVSVEWDFGDGSKAGNVNYPSHVYEKPGKYTVTLSVYGANGLTGRYTDTVLVEAPASQLFADIQEACIGGTVTLNANKRNDGGTYLWDFGDGNVVSTTDTFTRQAYLTPGVYTPSLLLTNGEGCMSAAKLTHTVKIRPNPTVQITPAQPLICLGTPVVLRASGGQTYSWSPGTGLSATNVPDPTASPTTDIRYTVKVKDDLGCENTGSVAVTVIQPTTVSLPTEARMCADRSVQLVATGAEVYKWINNTNGLSNTDIPDPIAKPTVTTEYTVRGGDKHGCFTDTKKITVQVLPLPTVNVGPDKELFAGEPVQLTPTYSSDVVKWQWTPAQYLSCTKCASPVSTPMANTQYTLTVYNNSCSASDSMKLIMSCQENRVRIPNAFSPNRDGANDVFLIKGISIVKHLVIFNRWGQKVYERSNFIAGDRSVAWDGTFNNYPAPAGTYVYLAEMQCDGGGIFRRKGSFILVR